MPRKIALLFAASLMFTVAACDTADETVDERSADAPDQNPDQNDVGAQRGHHGKFNPAEKLCAELECSDAQAAQIDELFASRHEGREKPDHEAHKAARAEANKAVADAFRADDFDVSVLDRVAPPEHDGADRETQMIEFASELHAILTPEQRAKLADKIEAGGPMFFGGHGPKGMKGPHQKRGPEGEGREGKAERDPAERLASKVDALCEPISCTAEQKTQLSATLQAAHEAKREAKAEHQANKPDFKPIADAFRADTLDTAKLRALMAEGKAEMQSRKADHGKEFGTVIAEIHDILTPEQRAIIADKIEADGLHAVMGGGHGRGEGKGKRGRRGRGGPDSVDAE